MTFSEENYLKIIYHLGQERQEEVTTNAIAEAMQTKASSVTDMLKKLHEKGWVEHKKYQGVSLTKEGEKNALFVIRKHRLWDVFLVEKLHFSWDEVHEVAEQLEHIQSDKLIEELDKLLDPAYRDKLQRDYQALRERLGNEGASRRTAQAIYDSLQDKRHNDRS